jgi:hypothetical protein
MLIHPGRCAMTRWTALTIAAVTNVVAVTVIAALWWGGGSNTAKTLALAGTVVVVTASLVVLFVVFRSARPTVYESAGNPPYVPPPDVEFRDRGGRFGPP